MVIGIVDVVVIGKVVIGIVEVVVVGRVVVGIVEVVVVGRVVVGIVEVVVVGSVVAGVVEVVIGKVVIGIVVVVTDPVVVIGGGLGTNTKETGHVFISVGAVYADVCIPFAISPGYVFRPSVNFIDNIPVFPGVKKPLYTAAAPILLSSVNGSVPHTLACDKLVVPVTLKVYFRS